MVTSTIDVVRGHSLRPDHGEALEEGDAFIDATSEEFHGALPFGDCRCVDTEASGTPGGCPGLC
jgi:hypothetical protein